MLASNFLPCENSCDQELLQLRRSTFDPRNPLRLRQKSQGGGRSSSQPDGRLTSSTVSSFERNEEACELMEQLLVNSSASGCHESSTSASAVAGEHQTQRARLKAATRSIGCRLARLGGALLRRLRPQQRRPQRSGTSSSDVVSGGSPTPVEPPPPATPLRTPRTPRTPRMPRTQRAPPRRESLLPRPCGDFVTAAGALAAAAADVPDACIGSRQRSRRRERERADGDSGGSGQGGIAAALGEDLNSSPQTRSARLDLCSDFDTAQAATVAGDWASAEVGAGVTATAGSQGDRGPGSAASPASADTFDHYRQGLSRLGLCMAIGFQPVGRRHGWSALVTAVPSQAKPAWSGPQFDWSLCGSEGSHYLIKAVFTEASGSTSTAPALGTANAAADDSTQQPQQQQQQKQNAAAGSRRQLTLIKYPLSGQPIQLLPSATKPGSAASPESAARLLTPQAEARVPCSGRLVGLFCTAGYVTVATRQRDNLAVRVYSSDLWPITTEWLMRNQSLVKEATDPSDISNEKVQCLTVDKTEQQLMFYHSYRVPSAGNKTLRRLCSLSLPDLQLSRRLPLKADVKSVKVGAKYFAVYFVDNRLTVYCKTSRSPVFEFSAQKLGGLFLGDTFEMDSQDRLVEVSEKRVHSLFYNGVAYRDCNCTNLHELGRRSLIGHRAEFYEALQCHLATMRLTGSGGKVKKACQLRLRLNGKLLRRLEELMCRGGGCGSDATMPIVVCEGAFWLEGTPEAGRRSAAQRHHYRHGNCQN